jgi:photosystem II stability/assembly factor-like uncharacterized protein
MRNCVVISAVALSMLIACLGGFAASAQEGGPRPPAAETVKPALSKKWADTLSWRSIGPACMGGRIVALAVYEADPTVWWAATASGGLLKTTNNGITFVHQFDGERTVSIGDVAVAPSDPNIVWVGTGESNPRNSVSWGDGVYKSTDGGATWKRAGLSKIFQTGRIVIHPENPEIVYVGALGRLWGPNEERGLFKTVDGGKTWKKILYIDKKTGVVDVQLKPGDPDTVVAATWERGRDGFDTNDPKTKWGPGSGLYRSIDGGDNFVRLTVGLPSCNVGRIDVEYFRGDSKVLFALVESEKVGQEPENAPWMGISGEDVDVGARLTKITDDGPADKAGLEVGDIVISVEERPVLSYRDLLREMRRYLADDTVKITLSRDRKIVGVELTFSRRPGSEEDKAKEGGKEAKPGGKETEQKRRKTRSTFSSGLGGQRENVQEQQGKDGHEFGGLYRSDDGGDSWTRINSVNPRPMYFSQLRVDPTDASRIYVLGISLYRSKDGGDTFTADGGRGVHVDHHALWVDPRDGRHMILGCDGGVYVTCDRMENWDRLCHAAIGQFYHVTVDSRPNYRVYGGLQDNGSWGGPIRSRSGAGPINEDWSCIGWGDGFVCRVDPDDPDLVYYESQGGSMGRINLRTGDRGSMRPRAPRGTRYRFNWETPYILSHHNSRIFYCAGNYVFRSLDRGDGLKAISPEITATDRGSATALAESCFDADVLYVGTDDGALWRTRNGGHDWDNLFDLPDVKEKKKPKKKRKASQRGGGGGRAIATVNAGEEKKTEEPGAEPRAEPSGKTVENTPALPDDPVTGTWEGTPTEVEAAQGAGDFTITLALAKDRKKVTGSFLSERTDGEIVDGRYEAETGALTLDFETNRMTLHVTAILKGSDMTGTVEVGDGIYSLEFEAKRLPAGAGKGDGDSGKKEKDVDAAPDDGHEWKRIGELMPGPRWVTCLEPSRHKRGRVYVAFDGHRSDDDKPYILVSENNGADWRSLTKNLPLYAGSVRVVREDIENADILYLGTEFSAWVSIDRGATWTSLNGGLPTVAVHEFAQHPTAGEIVVATHGRSLWVLDATPLRQMTAETMAETSYLFEPNKVRYFRTEPRRGTQNRIFTGKNPPSEARIFYFIGKKARKVSLEITDQAGELIRKLEGETGIGLHRATWDLRRPAPEGNRNSYRRRGSRVPPGNYIVAFTVDNRTLTQTLVVEGDPDYPDARLWGEEYDSLMEGARR